MAKKSGKRSTVRSGSRPTGRAAVTRAPRKARQAARVASPRSTRAATAPVRKPPARKTTDEAPVRAAGARTADRVGKYVYCIIRSRRPLSLGPIGIGVEASAVYTVTFNELAAVVSDSPLTVLDPTRDNVLAHQRVNETVMLDHTVLPMSFGTVFKTHDDVAAFLRSAYDAFSGVLDKMQNKLEFGLKVIWDRDSVVEEIEAENEDIHRLKGEIELQKGSTYFARMQYGRLVDAALQAKSEEYISRIFDRLRDVSVASRANRPIGDRMILNAAFLVMRDHEAKFDKRVKELGALFPKLTFKYTGPWPPYNFVNIRLKLERA
jgi:hypothetical protein